MKVVLFCGGLGTRLQEYSQTIPKPMVEIGCRPIMWHLMRYYSHYGCKDFILALGYGAGFIKKYFLDYNEALSNDFTLSKGGKQLTLHGHDIDDWKITFVETGLNSNIGRRLALVEKYLEGEEIFMANYTDGLSDLNLIDYIAYFRASGKIACFLSVRLSQSFHTVCIGENGNVVKIEPVGSSPFWINGGFFVFKRDIFSYIRVGEELVVEPFQRLIADDQLVTYRNQGFWACMDTFKEKKMFDDMYARGERPWAVWETYKNGC